jgi:hypothetical protein
MWYVYIIRSESFPEQEYIGATEDLKRRLPEHNAGRSAPHRKVQALEAGLVLRLSRQIQSIGVREISEVSLRPRIHEKTPLTTYSPTAALSRSRSATISSLAADNSAIEHEDASRIDSGTARALSFRA